ncbi:hypothetical protein AAHA92_21419 [Salvia divinorum]|uniref:Uncharacterized protein n=1 Tax=Salvia divinorum TaxID=28513 RepID=A0ABD1GKE0_SALDI
MDPVRFTQPVVAGAPLYNSHRTSRCSLSDLAFHRMPSACGSSVAVVTSNPPRTAPNPPSKVNVKADF